MNSRLLRALFSLFVGVAAFRAMAAVGSFRIDAPKTTITVGETIQLHVVAVSDDGSEVDVTNDDGNEYRSYAPIASVSAVGMVNSRVAVPGDRAG